MTHFLRISHVVIYALAAFLFLTPSAFAHAPASVPAAAQPTAVATPSVPAFSPQIPKGLISCFDVYKFGSVTASLAPSLSQVAQSATIAFTGTIKNQNKYPIDDATLYIKIFHDRTGGTKNINGPDVVDWFPAVAHFTLKAGESKKVSFTWKVPPDAQPGAYEAASYIAASNRFELFGVSFTDDITGSMTRFSVVGNNIGAMRFKKNSVLVNNTPFYFAAFPPTIASSTKTVPVSVTVENTKATSVSATVTWKLYYWDALQQSHLLSKSTQQVNLPSGTATTLTYIVKNTKRSTYYLLGTLTDSMGSKSIIGVRYVRSGVNEPRFGFVGVSAYPAQKGKGEAIACVHSTGTNNAKNSTVTITATKSNEFLPFISRTVARATWSGSLPGGMVALAAPFTDTSSSFNLTAKLYQRGVLVDTVTLPYSCSTLGATCTTSASEEVLVVIIAIVILLILLAAVIVYRERQKKEIPPPTS